MFLEKLSDIQKKTFLYMAQKLITVDNKIRISEISLLKNIVEEMNIQVNDALKIEDMNEICHIFTSRESRIITLIELIRTGYIDNEFCASENDLIKNISAVFSISETELQSIEAWVKEERSLYILIEKLSSKEELSEEEKREITKLRMDYEAIIQRGLI